MRLRVVLPALALAAVTLLLRGCPAPATRELPPGASSPVPQPAPPPPAVSSPAVPPPPRALPPARENHLSPATLSLVTQAHYLTSHGDIDGASSTLDRALRIEPNNPLLWIEMGRLRLTENDAHQAEGCGRKALTLGGGDRGAQARAGRLLADALRAEGRNQEAVEVERQPYMR